VRKKEEREREKRRERERERENIKHPSEQNKSLQLFLGVVLSILG
jgi:hypothetical protein